MTTIIRIPSILWKIGLVWGLLRMLAGTVGISLPPELNWVSALSLFVFLDINLWIALAQIFGSLYVRIAYGSKLPSADNYVCKADYILPFKGKWTVFNGGVSKALSHSWGILPQRYAYDFIIMDDEGKSLSGDNKSLQSYYCYGQDVIAPADGTVVRVSSKHKDSRVTGSRIYCDAWDIRGNFIVIEHAEKEFSLIAHLMPGSVTMRVGDRVKQGEIIAKCGNSGNTSEPHIHFQLQSGKSFFASAGLPISFVDISAQEKINYAAADPRYPQKELLKAKGRSGFYIGRGLEVENGSKRLGES